MHKHSDEEHGVEIRNWGGKANNGTPSERHCPVRNVILRKRTWEGDEASER